MAHYNFQKTLLVAPLFLGVAACGGGGGGTAPEEAPTGPLASFAEREAFAEEVITQQQQIADAGAADPADLPASASYDGAWVMSLDPESAVPEVDNEIIGGSVALEADFASGALTGTMEQEILDGADGTLTVENGTVSGAQLDGDLQGSITNPDGGTADIATNLEGFVSDTGAQGTMSGTATQDGVSVSAQGAFGAVPDGPSPVGTGEGGTSSN